MRHIRKPLEQFKNDVDSELRSSINGMISLEHQKIHPVPEHIDNLHNEIITLEQMLYDDAQKLLRRIEIMEETGYRIDDKLEAMRLLLYSDIKQRYEKLDIHIDKEKKESIYAKMMDLQKRFQEFKKAKKEDCICATPEDEEKVNNMINEVFNIRKELINLQRK